MGESAKQLATKEMTAENLTAICAAGETMRKLLKTQFDMLVDKKKWDIN